MGRTTGLFVAVLAFAAGIIAMDVAHDLRFGVPAGVQHVAKGTITHAGLTQREADLLCAHYHATGQSWHCDML